MSPFEIWMLVLTALALTASSAISIWAVVFGVKRSDIQALRAELNGKAQELVNAKFATLAAEMESPLAVLKTVVEGMKERMEWGEDQFVSDGDKLHRIELACKQTSAETKSWALEHFATHGQLAGVSEELRKLQVALARCEEACKREEFR